MFTIYSSKANAKLRTTLGACLALVLSAALFGCGQDVEKKVALATLSATCRINSDCASPLVCTFQLCHQACDTSRDCAHGERCVEGTASRNVCQLPSEEGCSATGYCPGAQVCGVDAQCRDGCASDGDCVSEQLCSGGTCADTKELDDSGALTPSPKRPENTPTPCAFDSDCADQQRCIERACQVECSLNSDCPQGQTCENARCQPTSSVPGCRYHSDCADDEVCSAESCTKRVLPPEPACKVDQDCSSTGQHCQQGTCVCECESSQDCGRGQSCDEACACVADQVIYGDVTVQNDVELAELDNVVEITGTLSITLSGLPDTFHVPNLRRVNNLFCYRGSTVEPHLVFDALEEATNAFSVGFLVEAPHLKKTSSFSVSSETAKTLEFPELADVSYLGLSSLQRVTRASFPKIRTLGSLSLVKNPLLNQLELPALTTLQGLSLNNDAFRGDFALPDTHISGYVQFQGNQQLSSVSLPGATDAADVYVTGNAVLHHVSLPGLETMNRLYLEALPQLQTFELGALESITADLSMKGNVGALSLSLPKLTTVSKVDVLFTTGLLGLDMPELTHADGFSINTSNIGTLDLPKLTSVGDIFLETNRDLTRLTMPALPSANNVYIGLADKLTDINLSSLATVAGLNIRITGITNVDTIDPTLKGKLTQAGGISITANPDLPSCLVTALQTHLNSPPYNWVGAVENQLNCACAGACP